MKIETIYFDEPWEKIHQKKPMSHRPGFIEKLKRSAKRSTERNLLLAMIEHYLLIALLFLVMCLSILIWYRGSMNKILEDGYKIIDKDVDITYNLSSTKENIDELANKHANAQESMDNMMKQISMLENDKAALKDELALSKDVEKELTKRYKKAKKEVKTLEKNMKLYSKYKYLLEYNGKRTDISYAQVAKCEKEMTKIGLDPNLLFAFIMVESKATENCRNKYSTAKGFGQMLDGTAKYTYKDKYGNLNGYYPDITLDGDKNLELCIHYLKILKRQSHSIYQMIDRYRGLHSDHYINLLNGYLKKGGTSIDKINRETKF